jgi:hypothetical protein
MLRPALTVVAGVSILMLAGCSARDPVTKTPVYHVGTPTNRSTTYSWIPNNQPFYVQPGVDGGKPLPPMKPVPSQRGFEPYDPLAASVYNTIKHRGINVTYITTAAKDGTVVVEGAVTSERDKQTALAVARAVPGVIAVNDRLKVE